MHREARLEKLSIPNNKKALMNPSSDPSTPLGKALREPTLHFVLIAALLFAVYALRQGGHGEVLEISQQEIDARIFMQELASGEAVTDEQRELITALYIEEQILVEEAKKMGLDNDARIHDMLAQKMRHVLSGDIIQPDETQLAEYFDNNRARYTTLPTVTTEELVFNDEGELDGDVQRMLGEGAEAGAMLELETGSVSLLRNANQMDLRNIFSEEFGNAVFSAAPQQWIGPYVSNRGQHWLRVVERTPATQPELEEIVDRVRLDWIAEEEEALLQEEVDRLWDRYSIIITNNSTE